MVFFALIYPDGPLVDVVKQIEVKIICSALVQRYIEKRDVVHGTRKRMAGEFISEIIAVTRVFLKRFSNCYLGFSAKIRISSVEIVDSVLYSEIEH